MGEKVDRCSGCEVFKSYEDKQKSFALGFFCPIKDSFTLRDDEVCEWVVSDNLPF